MEYVLSLCGRLIRLRIEVESLVRQVEAYYAPCLIKIGQETSEMEAVVTVGTSGVRVDSKFGLVPQRQRHLFFELERCLLQLIQEFSRECPLLHAACLVWEHSPILIFAPSGGGKSTMSKSLLEQGARYVTDDLVLLRNGCLYGFARSIRMNSYELREPLPHFLNDTDVETLRFSRASGAFAIPIWWNSALVEKVIPLSENAPVVVDLRRGAPGLQVLSSLERNIVLHEAAITSTGVEYDGSLPHGRSYRLSWTDPKRAAMDLLSAICEPT